MKGAVGCRTDRIDGRIADINSASNVLRSRRHTAKVWLNCFICAKLIRPLGAGGQRKQIQTSDDTRFYAFLRDNPDQMPVLAVFNFQPGVQSVSLNLADRSFHSLEDLLTGEKVNPAGDTVTFDLPAYGYRFLGLKV